MNLKRRIKFILKDRKIKQVEFAETLKIDQSYVSKILSEKSDAVPSPRLIDDICEAYNINKEWLLNGIGDPYIKLNRSSVFAKAVNEIFKDEDPFIANMIVEIASLPKEEKDAMKKAFEVLKKITSTM